MANFQPLNNYSLFLLNKIINKYKLKDPFLDIACGSGYVSKHLAKKGWNGRAIDYSTKAVLVAKKNLANYPSVSIDKKSLMQASGKYNTILMFDILEHIPKDTQALKKANSLLNKKGYLVIAGPSNAREWRWDDDYYGHVRRYSEEELKSKFKKTGFNYIICFDYTFPFFWFLRRVYTRLIYKKPEMPDKGKQTLKSSFSFAWQIPILSELLNNLTIIWLPVYVIQFIFFKHLVSKGSAMIMLAQKI